MNPRMKLLPLMLLAVGHGALAQQLPGAGSQLRQLPTPPTPPQSRPQIRIEDGAVASTAAADAASVLVNQLQVTGASVFSSGELVAVAGFAPGTRMTLAQMQAMAARITQHYRSRGYFVARAYLPAQDVTSNTLTIAVSEGVLGQVTLRNQSTLDDGVALSRLSGLESGAPLTIDPIENRLLLLSDIPGVVVQSTMVPGQAPGSSDLVVDIEPGRRITGSIDADNAGNRYTGEYRIGSTVNLNNPLGRGDMASLRVLTSGSGLNYARGSYQMPFGRFTAGVAYSRLNYELGEEYEDLGAHGTADVASLFGAITLVRSRNTNLYAGLAYEDRSFEDRIDLIPSLTRKKARVVTASLYGNHYDSLGGGGANAFYLGLSSGELDIRTPEPARPTRKARAPMAPIQSLLSTSRACSGLPTGCRCMARWADRSRRATWTHRRNWWRAGWMACAPIRRAKVSATKVSWPPWKRGCCLQVSAGMSPGRCTRSPSSMAAASPPTRIPGTPAPTTAASAAPVSA